MFNKPSGRPVVIMIGLSVFVLLILVSGLLPWQGLNCKYLKVDIHSGRQRTTLHLLFIPVSDTIEETWVSREIVNPASPPDWRTVCRFAPFWSGYSPNMTYHNATAQINQLEFADQYVVPFTPAAKSQASHRLIVSWQSGSDAEGFEYVQQVMDRVMQASDRRQAMIDVADLP